MNRRRSRGRICGRASRRRRISTESQSTALRSCGKNAEALRASKFALALVERIEHVRLENNRGRHMKKVEGSGAKLPGIPARKNQRLFPDLGTNRLYAKHTHSLMLLEDLVDGPSLGPCPLFSEHSQLDGVGEFRLAKRGEEKYRLGLHQGGGGSR